MIKVFAKVVGWLFLFAIGLGIALMGVVMIAGMVGMAITYVIPAAIGLFIVGSVAYVLWGIVSKA